MSNKINTELANEQLERISKIIKKYNLQEDLVDNDVKNIYEKSSSFNFGNDTSLISQLLYSINIDPLNYLDKVPRDFLFKCDSLVNFVIPNNVISIGHYAFYGCTKLINIVIPDSVTSIGDYAFRDCKRLTSVLIPGSTTSISICAFNNCESLTSVTIGNGVKNINYMAFSNCSRLTSVVIPDSVTSIKHESFKGCDKLNSVTYLGTIANWNKISIYDDTFPKNLKEIKCKDGVINL
ncbi:MAG: leucine-rich repeat domain-containing protein [Romboutsia timonensis]